MPRIFDNIDAQLLPALRQALEASVRADFSVGYFNLRGWRDLAPLIDRWAGGDGACCRLLVGMQRPPEESLKHLLGATPDDAIDNQTAILRRRYGLDGPEETLERIADGYGVTRERVRQIQARAERELRGLLDPVATGDEAGGDEPGPGHADDSRV